MQEEKFDINEVKKRMLRKYPSFGSTINNVKYEINNSIETACTDGKAIYFNPTFMQSLNSEEQVFIFSHEVCHIALNHILRSKGKQPYFWNVATDAVINQHLVHDGLTMVEGAIDIKDALEYDAEELYNKLLEESKKNQQEDQGNSGNGSDNQSQQGNYNNGVYNSHSMWEDAVKEHEKETNSNQKQPDQNQNCEQNNKQPKISEKDAFKENEEEKYNRAKEIMNNLKKARKDNSLTDYGSYNNIGKVGKAKAVTNWKKLLIKELNLEDEKWGHRFSDANNNYAARIEDVEIDEQAETEIILDVSGSVSKELLKSFLRQVKHILKNSKIKVGTFSNIFHGFVEIKKEKDIDNLTLNIGGGTNFECASRAFTKRKDVNKICFTDGEDGGYAEIRDKRKDIIWISFRNKKFAPDYGKVIYVDEHEIYNFVQNEREL